MRRRELRRKAFTEINITPFTDVVLVLLIIFMISAPIIMRKENIKINLPQAAKVMESQETPGRIVINITESDDVFLDNIKYDVKNNLNEFKERLESLIGKNKNVTVAINGDKKSKYESVIAILDVASQIGIKQISLGVELQGKK